MSDNKIQYVTFQLGNEVYGIDIMDVKEIVSLCEVRDIPGAPSYIAGILNLRGVILPVIDLHQRFQLAKIELSEEELLLSGYIIIDIDNIQLGMIIDKIVRVVTIDESTIQPPPQMMSGIGVEYIHGVVKTDEEYLICLNIRRIFNPSELLHIQTLGK